MTLKLDDFEPVAGELFFYNGDTDGFTKDKGEAAEYGENKKALYTYTQLQQLIDQCNAAKTEIKQLDKLREIQWDDFTKQLANLQTQCNAKDGEIDDFRLTELADKEAILSFSKQLTTLQTQNAYLLADAERYRFIRHKISANTRKTFHFEGIVKPVHGADLWKGSVAGHLDEAIDAAKAKGGE